MRLLVDACLSLRVVQALRAAGYEVEWVGDWETSPSDEDILAHAYAEGQVIVTLDKDFGTLAVALGRLHRGIIRIAGWPLSYHAPVILAVLERHRSQLEAGALMTVTPGRTRIHLSAQ
jgi:predicted nuclease of predicted toxin-antitoxin system